MIKNAAGLRICRWQCGAHLIVVEGSEPELVEPEEAGDESVGQSWSSATIS